MTGSSDAHFVAMDDGVRLRTWVAGVEPVHSTPVVLIHGGPGLPDYLAPVAAATGKLWRVHRYDQRGSGGSPWDGEHTVARHIQDLRLLLDAWDYDRAILVGHSFGTDLVSFFQLAHPDRVAGVVYLSGPFLGPWRELTRAAERERRSNEQQARLDELAALMPLIGEEEVEFLTLTWFPDHADTQQAWTWAESAARTRRPINYAMNRQLNADKRVVPLESQVEQLQAVLPPGTTIIGGDGDPRPASFLRDIAARLNCNVTIISSAGHEPWLEQPEAFRTAFRSALTTIKSYLG
jgi:proline iminopeptidase